MRGVAVCGSDTGEKEQYWTGAGAFLNEIWIWMDSPWRLGPLQDGPRLAICAR